MSRFFKSPCWAIPLLLLPGCSHPAAVPVSPKVVSVSPAPPPLVMPAPVVWDGRQQAHDDPNDPALIGQIGHPAPVGMLIDMDGTPCNNEGSTCHPNGDMINGRKWPHGLSAEEEAAASEEQVQARRDALSARYDAISDEREQIQEQEQQIYIKSAHCSEGSDCEVSADDALYTLRHQDIALGTQQAQLQVQYLHNSFP